MFYKFNKLSNSQFVLTNYFMRRLRVPETAKQEA